MIKNIIKALKLPDIRRRILQTLLLLLCVRALSYIPLPGISSDALKKLFSGNDVLGLLNLFSGGALSNFSIGFMGVGPYITASIVIQLLTFIIPSLEQLQKEEGEAGRMKINQYTRLITVPLAIIQSFGLLSIIKSQGLIGPISSTNLISILIISTGATMLFMWLGELISEQGIGNGMSLIITMGILAGIPLQFRNVATLIFAGGTIDTGKLWGSLLFLAIVILTIVFIIIMNEAIRRIPISYSRSLRSGRSSSVVDTYLPIKINAAGVIPIIFALSIMIFPSIIGKFLEKAQSPTIVTFAQNMVKWFDPSGNIYMIVYFIMVVLFTFFYTGIVFKPKDIAENLQKQSGFIPGIRPGAETASFLTKVVNRITLPGSIFLGIIAILPFIVQSITHIPSLVIGGTGVLIIVSVILETSDQLKAHLMTSEYESYS